MKIHVLRDAKGHVIATFEKRANAQVHVEPVVPDGHSVQEVDAPEDYHRDLGAFYKQHSR